MKLFIGLTFCTSLVIASTCLPDIILDDFSSPIVSTVAPTSGRNVNLQGGDYGTDSAATTMNFVKGTSTVPGYVSVLPSVLQVGQAQNFFFTKINALACYDLTGYQGFNFQMQVIDPTQNAVTTYDSSFTMTQKSADCTTIVQGNFIALIRNLISGAESQYQPLSKFTPLGRIYGNTMYNMTLPFANFTQHNNASFGANYDFSHFKVLSTSNQLLT